MVRSMHLGMIRLDAMMMIRYDGSAASRSVPSTSWSRARAPPCARWIVQRCGVARQISQADADPMAASALPQSQIFASWPSSVRGGYCLQEPTVPAEAGQPSTKIIGPNRSDATIAARNAPMSIAAVRCALRSGRILQKLAAPFWQDQ
jgi:hypothetical protein